MSFSKIKILILFVPFLFTANLLKAQEINWSNLSFGGILNYSFTNSDFEEYWGNFPSAGVAGEYSFSENFSLESSVSVSYLKSKYNSNEIPDFIFINIPGGFKYYFLIVNNFDLNFSIGLTSSTFVFKGAAAERLSDNFIESEFGIYGSLGSGSFIYKNFYFEFFLSGQSIFTSPESILLINTGVKVLWK